jgi:Fe-S cluster biogenesis protein NfuA
MFIQTEETPNPNALKFIPGKSLGPLSGRSYAASDGHDDNGLVLSLLDVDGVSQLFFGQDFITVTKSDDADWMFLKPHILGAIMDFFMTMSVDSLQVHKASEAPKSDRILSEIEIEISAVIDDRIRPAVESDGGYINFDRFEEGIVYVSLGGACSGCPSSELTLKSGIENTLRYYIPEVTEVRSA